MSEKSQDSGKLEKEIAIFETETFKFPKNQLFCKTARWYYFVLILRENIAKEYSKNSGEKRKTRQLEKTAKKRVKTRFLRF